MCIKAILLRASQIKVAADRHHNDWSNIVQYCIGARRSLIARDILVILVFFHVILETLDVIHSYDV